MKKTYVLFSDNAIAPAEVIVDDLEMIVDKWGNEYELQEVETAENEGKRYAHYYKELLNEHDITEYHYVTTKNA